MSAATSCSGGVRSLSNSSRFLARLSCSKAVHGPLWAGSRAASQATLESAGNTRFESTAAGLARPVRVVVRICQRRVPLRLRLYTH
jgi:hypothetical protein